MLTITFKDIIWLVTCIFRRTHCAIVTFFPVLNIDYASSTNFQSKYLVYVVLYDIKFIVFC